MTELPRADSNPKSAFGSKKPSPHLIPGTAQIELARVFALGAAKYGPFNWRETSVAASVYQSAALRHLLQWFDGDDRDTESGASHLAHAMACCAILLDASHTGNLIDDRPPPSGLSDLIKELTVV